MTHSQMLTIRRRKQKARKRLARTARQAKKLGKQRLTTAGADATKKETV